MMTYLAAAFAVVVLAAGACSLLMAEAGERAGIVKGGRRG